MKGGGCGEGRGREFGIALALAWFGRLQWSSLQRTTGLGRVIRGPGSRSHLSKVL
jgi:hypothetical protein